MAPARLNTRTARLTGPLLGLSGLASWMKATPEASPSPAASPASSPATTPGASPSASPAASPIVARDDAGIPRRVSALLKDEAGVYGIVIAQADGKVLCSRNSDLPFMTASLYKLILMADIYRQIERGSLGQGDLIELDWSVFSDEGESYFGWDQIGSAFPLQEYLFAAGAYSSNAAAWLLLGLTSPDDLARTAGEIGLTRTHVIASLSSIAGWPFRGGADLSAGDDALATSFVESWGAWGDAVSITTPRDMAIYFHALLTETLLSPWVSSQITAILAQQQVRDRIPALLPAGTKTIHKTGNLDSVVNDAGVIEMPGDDRIVVLLSEAMPSDTRATLLLQRLALIATGATTIPPLDVPNPAGLDQIDTTDPATWAPGDQTPEPGDGSDGTDGVPPGDASDELPDAPPDPAGDGDGG